MKKIRLIAVNTIWELLSKKSFYLLILLIIFMVVGNAFELYSLIYADDTINPADLQSRKVSLVANMIGPWASFTILFSIIFAAGAVYSERKSKTIVGVLAKPVSRDQYLAGKILGVHLLFGFFLMTGVLLMSVLMLVWNIEFTALFWTGVADQMAMLLVFSGISFVLSLFITPYLGGGITFLIWSFIGMFENLIDNTNWVVSGLGYLLYYGSPALNSDPLISWGVNNNAIHAEMLLYWGVIAENLLYFGIILFLGMLLFRRKDIVVG